MKLFTTDDEKELDALFKEVEESYKLAPEQKGSQDQKYSFSRLFFLFSLFF